VLQFNQPCWQPLNEKSWRKMFDSAVSFHSCACYVCCHSSACYPDHHDEGGAGGAEGASGSLPRGAAAGAGIDDDDGPTVAV
jgi:hypothetical protein